MLEARQLKDNLVNQSFALRDLVQTKTKLISELRVERELRERILQSYGGPATGPVAAGPPDGPAGPVGTLPPGSARKLSSASLSAAAALGLAVSPVLGRVVKRSEEVRCPPCVCTGRHVCV
jgi:hypothetical protein